MLFSYFKFQSNHTLLNDLKKLVIHYCNKKEALMKFLFWVFVLMNSSNPIKFSMFPMMNDIPDVMSKISTLFY